MELLLGCIIPFISFVLQSYPRLLNKYFGVDVWTRLTETDSIRKNNHRIPGKITKGFIISGYFDYPPLFPWILSFFSKRILVDIQGFVAPFFDALNCLTVFFIGYLLTNRIEISLFSQLVYMLTPLIALENSYLTPRSFGYLNFTLAVFPLLQYSVTNNVQYLYASYIFGSIIFLTHRFATQSYFFTMIFLSIYDKNPAYFGLFILCALTATVLTRGYYIRVFKGHLYNIYFWVGNYKLRFAHQVRGILESATVQIDFISLVYYVFEKFTPFGLLATSTSLLGPIVIVLKTLGILNVPIVITNLIIKMSYLSVFFYILAIFVISIKKLIPIGEGQRYLEMNASMVSIIFAISTFSLVSSWGSSIWFGVGVLLIGNLTVILIAQQKAILKDKNRSLTKDLQKIYQKINTLKGTPRIICIPHQITTMTIYHTKADILVNADNSGLLKITDVYPVLKKPIKTLTKKYHLSHLLLRESFASKKEVGVNNFQVVAQFGDISLINLQKYN